MIRKLLRRTVFWSVVLGTVLYSISQFPDRFQDAAEAYRDGDFARAMQLWRALAKNDDDNAQHNIGSMYKNGHGVEQSDAAAQDWFLLAAEGGNPVAQFEVGKNFETGTGVDLNLPLGLFWIKKAADQGYPPAQTDIGLKYLLGDGVEENRVLALAWLDRASGRDRDAPVLFSEHLNDTAYALPCSDS